MKKEIASPTLTRSEPKPTEHQPALEWFPISVFVKVTAGRSSTARQQSGRTSGQVSEDSDGRRKMLNSRFAFRRARHSKSSCSYARMEKEIASPTLTRSEPKPTEHQPGAEIDRAVNKT